MRRSVRLSRQSTTVTRTLRLPSGLHEKISADARRCERTFNRQVIALLCRHYGDDVDIVPRPAEILGLAAASFADVPITDLELLTQKLFEEQTA